MDKIFHSTFDFFTHVLPGFAVLCALFIMFPEMNYPKEYLELAGRMTVGSGVFVLVASYLIGFAINPIGRWIYRGVNQAIKDHGKKIVEDKETKETKKEFKWFFLAWFSGEPYEELALFISDKFVLIRELNPANFRYVETWHMFCAMAHNLVVASLAIIGTTLWKLFRHHPPNPDFWWMLLAIAVLCFFIFLHRAIKFSKWAADDLNAAVRVFQLPSRALKSDSADK